MIAEGVMDDPKVDAVIGLHLWATYPVGKIAVQPGAVMASADELILRVRGHGGHGAVPHEAVDPIVAAAQIVVAAQTLISREVSPFHPAVLTWGAISGGTAFNIIADEVELRGTLRTYDEADRDFLKRRLANWRMAWRRACARRRSVTIGLGTGAASTIQRSRSWCAPPPRRRSGARTSRRGHAPDAERRYVALPRRRPGCYFFVGAGNVERGIIAPHHNARFDIDEAALAIGVETMARAALAYLAPDQDEQICWEER